MTVKKFFPDDLIRQCQEQVLEGEPVDSVCRRHGMHSWTLRKRCKDLNLPLNRLHHKGLDSIQSLGPLASKWLARPWVGESKV